MLQQASSTSNNQGATCNVDCYQHARHALMPIQHQHTDQPRGSRQASSCTVPAPSLNHHRRLAVLQVAGTLCVQLESLNCHLYVGSTLAWEEPPRLLHVLCLQVGHMEERSQQRQAAASRQGLQHPRVHLEGLPQLQP